MTSFHVRPTTEDDWQQVRELRLEMIRDTPLAFGESLEVALRHPEAEWRIRGARGRSDRGIVLAAIDDETDRWIATMGGYLDGWNPLLVGVYVTPDRRGRTHGVADALIAGIEEWAKNFGTTITLHVHEDNIRARAFYERLGYRPTGRRFAYVLDRSKVEFELNKRLEDGMSNPDRPDRSGQPSPARHPSVEPVSELERINDLRPDAFRTDN